MLEACSIDKKDTGVFLSNERKTKWVTLISLFTMIVEIGVGYWSGSMALLADGWHMASHTLALFLSLVVYYLYRHPRFKSSFTFGGGKILSLGGYQRIPETKNCLSYHPALPANHFRINIFGNN